MQRLFVAVPIPDQIKEELLDLKINIPGARWTPDNQMHITLKFIGEVEDQSLNAIKGNLSEIIMEKFLLKLMGVGVFPPGNFPKVLWAGLESQPELSRLRNKIEGNLNSLGIKREGRKFRSHITLARLKNVNISRVLEFLRVYNSFSTELFQVEEFFLFSSRLYPNGAVHSVEAVYSLG